MPVYKILEEMPYTELLGWMAFFDKNPVGYREDGRFMKILQAMGIKAKPEEVFSSLATLKASTEAAPVPGLKNSYLFQLMMGAGEQPLILSEL